MPGDAGGPEQAFHMLFLDAFKGGTRNTRKERCTRHASSKCTLLIRHRFQSQQRRLRSEGRQLEL